MYKIKNEILNVEISEHGAEIKAIKVKGVDVLHDSNPEYWNRSAPYLFPNIGTIKDKYTIINDKQYPLTKHGFIRDVDFEVVEKKESELILIFNADDFTLNMYPFKFEFIVHYQLVNDEIKTLIEILNKDKETMPFNFGLHPAFKIPFDGGSFEDYQIEFDKEINFDTPTVDLKTGTVDFNNPIRHFEKIKSLKLNHEDYQFDALVVKPYPIHNVKIISPNNKQIIVKCDQFKLLGIWTPYPKKAPFICIEPWIGYADKPNTNHQFNNKEDLIYLKPNEKWSIEFSYQFKL